MSISKFLLAASLISLNMAGANELKLRADKVVAPCRLGEIDLTHRSGQFYASSDGDTKEVLNHNVSKEIRCIDAAKLKVLMKSGYIAVDRSTNGDFKLQFNPRIKGGLGVGAAFGVLLGKGIFWVVGEAVGAAAGLVVGGAGSVVGTPIAGAIAGSVTKTAVSTGCKILFHTIGNKAAIGLGIFFGSITPI
jgi:hypothetical protein